MKRSNVRSEAGPIVFGSRPRVREFSKTPRGRNRNAAGDRLDREVGHQRLVRTLPFLVGAFFTR